MTEMKVGYEVEVVVKYSSFERSFQEGIEFFVDIEYHDNRDNQSDGKDVSPQEFFDNIEVDFLYHTLLDITIVELHVRPFLSSIAKSLPR